MIGFVLVLALSAGVRVRVEVSSRVPAGFNARDTVNASAGVRFTGKRTFHIRLVTVRLGLRL